MDTALGEAVPVDLRALSPGSPNIRLIAQAAYQWDMDEAAGDLCVPIMTLEPQPILTWARAVARAEDVWIPGYLFNKSRSTKIEDEKGIDNHSQEEQEAASLSALERVNSFRATASPTAYRLAALLSAVPVSLPTIRLIQQTMLPEANQTHIAEVYLGGLLEVIPSDEDIVDPDYIEYDFIDGVRELLLSSLTVGESLEALSSYVERHFGQAHDFQALLANPLATDGVGIGKRARHFAQVATKVLSGLGRKYSSLTDWSEEIANQSLSTKGTMIAVSPTLKIRCPYCWKEFHPGDCAVYSTANPHNLIFPAPKPGTPEYKISRTRIVDLKGLDLALELPVRQCPYCKELLFVGIEECDNLNIAIIGDSASGKTHYIAVLIDLLERGVLAQNGNAQVQLIARDRDTSKNYRKIYYEPIIANHDVLLPTRRGEHDAQGRPVRSKPLIYLLKMQDTDMHTSKMLNLLFFDISGDDLADNVSLLEFGQYILHADGIIYLADPMSMEHIRQQVPQDLQSAITGRSAQTVLSLLAHRLEMVNNLRSGEKISIPVAITLSKSDLLQYVIPVQDRSNYWLFYGSHNDGKAHMEDIRQIDEEVRSILHRYEEDALINISTLFEQVSFFAVSATGYSPDPFTGKYHEIRPNRCLDPFVWLLWKRKFLQAVR
jgi:hypothetical protein